LHLISRQFLKNFLAQKPLNSLLLLRLLRKKDCPNLA